MGVVKQTHFEKNEFETLDLKDKVLTCGSLVH